MDSYGQTDIAVGVPDSPPGLKVGAWQGLTIKEILEKVDLSNIIMDDDEPKIGKVDSSMTGAINPEAAFLGPKLWSKPIQMPMPLETQDNEDFAVMNIDDFLSENGFDLNEPSSPEGGKDEPTTPASSMEIETELMEMPSQRKKQCNKRAAEPDEPFGKKEHDFLYVESKRARLEREKEEKRRKALEIEFSPQELALATVPGMEFDPRERSFAPDELRPQPIIRKRKKSFVPTEEKDIRYWEKREKNNVAARRSREARRLKENQIALRTAYLEKENFELQGALEEAKAENMELVAEKEILLEKLKQYESL